MSVHIIADTRTKASVLRGMLEQRYVITSELLDGANIPRGELASIVVAADLTSVENIAALKAISSKLARVGKRVFVIDGTGRLSVVQAYALGATHVLSNPVRQQQLLAKLADAPAITSRRTCNQRPGSGGRGRCQYRRDVLGRTERF